MILTVDKKNILKNMCTYLYVFTLQIYYRVIIGTLINILYYLKNIYNFDK